MSGSETVIREVTPGIWTFSKPFLRSGFVPFGGRSTAIKLEDGGVWVLASTPLTDETKAKLDELGPVKYIIGPDTEHSLYLREYKDAYPTAHLVGIEEHKSKPKLKDVTFSGCYGNKVDDPNDVTKFGYTANSEITACYFSGFKNKDVAFLHKASRTLVVADLLFNLPAKEQYSKSKTSSGGFVANYLNPGTWLHRTMIGSVTTDKKAMQQDAKTVAGWDFDRVIMCHGDVIETGGKKAWTDTYKNYLV